jgi:signal transduction histidine kinase
MNEMNGMRKNPAMMRSLKRAVIYAAVGGAWIFFSDRALSLITNKPEILTELQTIKGWFYVAVTAIILLILLYRHFVDQQIAHQKVQKELEDRRRAEEESRRLEDQLRQSQKMASVGILSAGLVHDINNILTPLYGYVDLVHEHLPAESRDREYLQRVLAAADRARDLAQQIIDFSRQSDAGKNVIPLEPIIMDTLNLMHGFLPPSIEVSVQMPEKTPLIRADQNQIHQVLMNLCLNAFQAMKTTGGKLEVRLEEIPGQEALPMLPSGDLRELCVRLTVRDTGCGIDDETMERIFEPFFTTKAPDEGTGLGLSVARRIIEDHGGSIKVVSEIGKGSSFIMTLPAADEKATLNGAKEVPAGGDKVTVADTED